MLDGLALLPVDSVPEDIPEGRDPLVDYFDQTSVTGSCLRIQQTPFQQWWIHPYASHASNVHIFSVECTWCDWMLAPERRPCVKHGIGGSVPSWAMLNPQYGHSLNLYGGNTTTQCDIGQPTKKRVRRHTKQLQERLVTIYKQCVTREKSLQTTLYCISHCIRLK